ERLARVTLLAPLLLHGVKGLLAGVAESVDTLRVARLVDRIRVDVRGLDVRVLGILVGHELTPLRGRPTPLRCGVSGCSRGRAGGGSPRPGRPSQSRRSTRASAEPRPPGRVTGRGG